MSKITLREKNLAVLKHLGYIRDMGNRSSKYVKMVKEGKPTYWVGSHGGLRFGRIASKSIGTTDLQKKRFLAYYDKFCK